MTQEELRAYLERLCPLCGISNRREATDTCSLCGLRACSVHRSIYGETVVCSRCYDDIKDGRRAVSPELRALMDESAAKWQACIRDASAFIRRWIAEGMTEDEALEKFWGKALIKKWKRL